VTPEIPILQVGEDVNNDSGRLGFRILCVRGFNASIQKVYAQTPTQIRRLARQKAIQRENPYFVTTGKVC
jgi:hypothetical protein